MAEIQGEMANKQIIEKVEKLCAMAVAVL